METKRDPSWKQDQPDQQLVVLIQSAEGWLLNLQSGCTPPDRAIEKIQAALDELKKLQPFVKTEW
jgi:hypothetical protein